MEVGHEFHTIFSEVCNNEHNNCMYYIYIYNNYIVIYECNNCMYVIIALYVIMNIVIH